MVFSVLNADYYVIHQVTVYNGRMELPYATLVGVCLFIYLPTSLAIYQRSNNGR